MILLKSITAHPKTSGAGGGDCGITIINKDVDKEKFMMNGQNMVLEPLKFNIYHGQ